MSRLDDLIQQYCPNGVDYLTIKECTQKVQNIKWKTYVGENKKYIDLSSVDRDTHCIMETQYIDANSAPSRAQQIVQKDDILFGTTRPMLKRYCMIPEDYNNDICSTGFCVLRAKSNIILPRWLYHIISTTDFFIYVEQNQKGASYPAISDVKVKAFKLPVPPLEVQREIVRVLDSFTLLTAELTAELTARKEQYKFYRNKLMTFGNNVKIVPLADIADIGTGSSNTNEGLEDGKYPFYVRSQEPLRKNEYEYDETAIITAGDGVGVGKVYHYVEGKYALHQRAYRIHINTPDVLPRYYFHYMRSAFLPYIQKTMFQGSVASIRRPMLNQFPVPVPALDVQKRLVNVLDNFEAICTDLNIGLPAEIEARQKQYEYYRDLLLTFAETGNTILTDRQTDRQTELSTIKLIQYVFGWAQIELGMVGKVSMCKRIMKSETSSMGDVPFYKIGTFGKKPDAYISRQKYDEYRNMYSYPKKGDILISAAGTIGRTVVYDGEDAYYQDSNIVWLDNDESIVLNRYLRYCYQLQPWNVSTGGTIARLYNDNISRTKICVPSIKEQKRIVDILDRFDTLCNNLSTGLPAEIEARQKQYEYYRDKLLSFDEMQK